MVCFVVYLRLFAVFKCNEYKFDMINFHVHLMFRKKNIDFPLLVCMHNKSQSVNLKLFVIYYVVLLLLSQASTDGAAKYSSIQLMGHKLQGSLSRS